MSLEGQPALPHTSREAWQALFSHPKFVPEIAQKRICHIDDFLDVTTATKGQDTTYTMAVKRAAMIRMKMLMSNEHEIGLHIDAMPPRAFTHEVSGTNLTREDVVFMFEEERYRQFEIEVEERSARRDAKIANRRGK